MDPQVVRARIADAVRISGFYALEQITYDYNDDDTNEDDTNSDPDGATGDEPKI